MDNLDKFCIDNTNHILLELPYGNWSKNLVEEIYELSISGYNIILAHIERYLSINGERVLNFVDLDVKFQISCSVPIKGEDRMFLNYLIKNKRYCIMGTDMHNMDTRPCDISDSFKRFEKKYKKEAEDLFYNNSYKILFS
jgi:protein-tyrosine phosphatase